jgi:hypothetical protein
MACKAVLPNIFLYFKIMLLFFKGAGSEKFILSPLK